MNMIDEVLERPEFKDNPPVLVDIGASGAIHREWKAIARHSIGIAFDADDREMDYIVHESSAFRKLLVYKRVVIDHKTPGDESFFLTRSPYCSSLLEPDNESLKNWAFGELFEVERKVTLKAVVLPDVLREHSIRQIDWFKTDSQGIDQRLFESLGPELLRRVLVADFEPGIIDVYKNEDKLWSLMRAMDRYPFWMSDFGLHGSQRIDRSLADHKLSRLERRFVHLLIRASPGWGEVSYMNSFQEEAHMGIREYLLAWVFAAIKRQDGFALELAGKGAGRFNDPMFARLEKQSLSRIKRGLLKLPIYACRSILRRTIAAFQ